VAAGAALAPAPPAAVADVSVGGPDQLKTLERRRLLLTVMDGVVLGLVLGVVLGVVAGPVVGVAVGVVAAVALSVAVARGSSAVLRRVLRAEQVDDDEFPGLRNVVEGLCATFGLRVPELMVVDDAVANSCVYGAGPRAVLVVTTGLADRLDLIETEGVVAHELAHLKRHDGALAAVAITALAPVVYLTGSDRLVHAALGRGREYLADQLAASTLRYPAGLHDALATMEQGKPPAPGSVFTGRRLALTRWLWIDPMVARRDDPVDGELDATSVRVGALGEW